MTATATADDLAATVHPFERAGLGRAPFRFAGCSESTYQACSGAPVLPGTSCDFCSTAIRNVFWIRSADGRRFKVGCDCVMKLGRADNRLVARVEREVKARARAQRREGRAAALPREVARIAAAEALAEGGEVAEALAGRPHPAFPGKTGLDYVRFLFRNGGHSGKLRAAKLVEAAAKATA